MIIKKIIIIILLVIFYKIDSVHSAELNFFGENDVRSDNIFEVKMILNAEQSINAIEGNIFFPIEHLQLIRIIEGDSIVKLWPEPVKEIEPGIVNFSGMIPGGWLGNNGRILTFEFRVIREGEIIIRGDNLRLFKHSRNADEVDIISNPLEIKIFSNDEIDDSDLIISSKIINDYELPENFVPLLVQEPLLHNRKAVLIFATQDKLSGLDRFEIKEVKYKFLRIFKSWKRAKSPYVLEDQSLSKYIYIKAIDRAKNERLVVLDPLYKIPAYRRLEFWSLIVVGLILSKYLLKHIFGNQENL